MELRRSMPGVSGTPIKPILSGPASGAIPSAGGTTPLPSGNVTRLQLAVALAQALPLQTTSSLNATDKTAISVVDQPAVSAVIAKGYLVLDGTGAFQPTKTVTREQTAEVLFKVLQEHASSM